MAVMQKNHSNVHEGDLRSDGGSPTVPRAILFNPPFYSNRYPNLGLHSVRTSLVAKGVDCEDVDLSVKYFNYLVGNILVSPGTVLSRATKIRTMELLTAKETLGILPTHFFTPLSFPQKEDAFNLNDAADVLRFAANAEANPFHRFYDAALESEAERLSRAGVAGISIISLHQVVPGLTLAAALRAKFPDLKILLGGSWCSTMRDRLLRNTELPALVDFIIHGEGETAAAALMEAIGGGRDFADVPNLIYRDGNRFRSSGLVHKENLKELPGLRYGTTDEYAVHPDGRSKTIVFETRRGCYWDKCTFCMHRDGIKGLKTEKDVDVLIEELRNGIASGANNVLFSDSAISPRRFREISQAIIDAGLKFEWWCFIRAEKGFDAALFELAYRAGCREVNVGVESVNERIGKLMNKGITAQNVSNILRAARSAGIETIVDMLVGFPTETLDECRENMDFLEANLPNICQIGANVFSLWKGTEIAEDPRKYGIVTHDDPNSLNPEIPFEVDRTRFPDAMSKNEALFMAGKMSLLNAKGRSEPEMIPDAKALRSFTATYDWGKVTPFRHSSSYRFVEFEGGELAIID